MEHVVRFNRYFRRRLKNATTVLIQKFVDEAEIRRDGPGLFEEHRFPTIVVSVHCRCCTSPPPLSLLTTAMDIAVKLGMNCACAGLRSIVRRCQEDAVGIERCSRKLVQTRPLKIRSTHSAIQAGYVSIFFILLVFFLHAHSHTSTKKCTASDARVRTIARLI